MTKDELLQDSLDRLALYKLAEQKILNSQSYSIGNRTMTRADLSEIKAEIRKLTSDIITLQRGNTIQIQGVVPRDL